MEVQNNEEYIYDSENGRYIWYNSFKEAFGHIDWSDFTEDENKKG